MGGSIQNLQAWIDVDNIHGTASNKRHCRRVPATYNTDNVEHVGTVVKEVKDAVHSTNIHIPPVNHGTKPVIMSGITVPK